MNKKAYPFVVVFITIILSGCMSLDPVKPSVVKKFTLSESPSNLPHARKTQSVLFISNVEANPGYTSARMIYTEQPFEMNFFSENSWIAAPAHMMTPLLVDSLAKTRHFKAVVSPPYVGSTDYRLSVKLLYLYQDFIQRPVTVKIAVSASLVSSKTAELLVSKRFEKAEPVPSNDPYGGVLAANRAVAKIQTQIARMVVGNT